MRRLLSYIFTRFLHTTHGVCMCMERAEVIYYVESTTIIRSDESDAKSPWVAHYLSHSLSRFFVFLLLSFSKAICIFIKVQTIAEVFLG